ncbi:F-box protein [Quillaja saponaria]|uniref:F-box protein n=1 Tax=Quillaja saponaria TaxID=32244 RepID=A0AAD7LFV8_QUISA|nr:F-box protein [Quillaja saponaria]KAJ7957017.1 F-box protein [Quillaja saponaria]
MDPFGKFIYKWLHGKWLDMTSILWKYLTNLDIGLTIFDLRIQIQLKPNQSAAEGRSSWSSLPPEIVQLILQRLSINDYLHLGKVCSSWRAAVAEASASKFCRTVTQLPWLMACTYHAKDRFFLCPSEERIFKPNPRHIKKHWHCVGSVDPGWFIMIDTTAFSHPFPLPESPNFFFNPVSGARVMLPSQSTISSDPYFFNKVVATSAPNFPVSDSCFLVALSTVHRCLAFCRLTDKLWTVIDAEETRDVDIHDIEIVDGKLYAVTRKALDFIMVFDLENSNATAKKLVLVQPKPVSSSRVARMQNGLESWTGHPLYYCLAKDSSTGELLLVLNLGDFVLNTVAFPSRSINKDNTVVPPKTNKFRVFKLHDSNGDGPRWVELHSLGHRSLFVTTTGCKVISLATTSCYSPHELVRGNCIYFAFHYACARNPSLSRDIGMFCFEDSSISRFLPVGSSSPICFSFVWFVPNPW